MMLIFSLIKCVEYPELSDDRLIELSLYFVPRSGYFLQLSSIARKYCGGVFCASICTLSIQRSGVVDGPKYCQDLLKRDDFGIKSHLYYFDMPRFTASNAVVRCVIGTAAAIAWAN